MYYSSGAGEGWLGHRPSRPSPNPKWGGLASWLLTLSTAPLGVRDARSISARHLRPCRSFSGCNPGPFIDLASDFFLPFGSETGRGAESRSYGLQRSGRAVGVHQRRAIRDDALEHGVGGGRQRVARLARSPRQALRRLLVSGLCLCAPVRPGTGREASDLTQGFFVYLLERRVIAKANAQVGRFRSFLLGTLKHYLLQQTEREGALRRGGKEPLLSLDTEGAERRFAADLATTETPETLFERKRAGGVWSSLAAAIVTLGKGSDPLNVSCGPTIDRPIAPVMARVLTLEPSRRGLRHATPDREVTGP